MGLDNVVGAIRYVVDDPGIESLWGEIFRTRPDQSCGTPSLLYKDYRVILRGKRQSGRGVALTIHRDLVSRLKKQRAIPLISLCALMVYSKLYFTFLLLPE